MLIRARRRIERAPASSSAIAAAGGRRPLFPPTGLLAVAAALLCFYVSVPFAQAGASGAAGDVYVTCWMQDKVVQLDGETGAFVTNFVAAGSGGLDRPFGLTWAANGNLLVVSEGYGESAGVVEYDGTTGALVRWVVGPGTYTTPETGFLQRPSRIALGADGAIYLSAQWNSAIDKYNGLTGEWLGTLAIGGLPNGGLRFPQGLTIGPNGNLFAISGYEADNPTGEGRGIMEYNPVSGRLIRVLIGDDNPDVFMPLGASLLFRPNGNLLLTSTDANLVTGDTYRNEVLEFDAATGQFLGAFVADGSGLNWGAGMAWHPTSGHLLVCSLMGNKILEYDGQTGALVGTFASGVPFPMGLSFKPAPVAPMSPPVVTGISESELDACEEITTVTVTGSGLDPIQSKVMLTTSGEPSIAGVVTGGTAASLQVDFHLGGDVAGGTRSVTVSNPDGQSTALAGAVNIAPCHAATEANLFVLGYRHRANRTVHALFELDGSNGNVVRMAAEDRSANAYDLGGSTGFVFGYDGNLLITSKNPYDPPNGMRGSVLRYDGITGRKLGTFIPAGAGGMLRPKKLTYGPNGNLFVLHTGVSNSPSGVLEFDGRTGAFVRVFASTDPLENCGLEFANDLEFGPNGQLYVTDQIAGVLAYDGQTGACLGANALIDDPSGGAGGDRFCALAFSPESGNLILPWGVDDPPWGRVTEHNPVDGALLDTPIQPGQGEMHAAVTAAFGPDRHLYVESYPAAILKYDIAAEVFVSVFAQQGNVLGTADVQEINFKRRQGDVDGDWDFDLIDIAAYQRCFGVEDIEPGNHDCLHADADYDGDVDELDWSALARRITGPK